MSTHFPPSQPDDAADATSRTAPRAPHETTHRTTNPPIPRGQRRGWNTGTGIIGGVGALSLLLIGAGTATAGVMTQERSDTWTASQETERIVVDTDNANVRIRTSPTAENVEVTWQEVGWNLGDNRVPEESDGVVRVDSGGPSVGWNSGINNIQVTVPENNANTSLELTADRGFVHVSGAFKDVTAASTFGSVSADAVKAESFDARTANGQVMLDGLEVSERLDAHTRNGFTSVRVTGEAPKRTSVTSESGAYELKMPTADYWYPQNSQQRFDDPRTPETVTPRGDRWADDAPSSSASPSPSAPASRSASPETEPSRSGATAPSSTSRDQTGIATAWTTDEACADAPGDRPCLFVAGETLNAADSRDMQYWREEWNSGFDEDILSTPWNVPSSR